MGVAIVTQDSTSSQGSRKVLVASKDYHPGDLIYKVRYHYFLYSMRRTKAF